MPYMPLANQRRKCAPEPEPTLVRALRPLHSLKLAGTGHRSAAQHPWGLWVVTLLSLAGASMASSESDSDSEPRPAIFDAIYAFDAEALRRELAAGVDPNVSYDGYTPLFHLVLVRAARYPEERIQERLECISLLLEAGASVDFRHLYIDSGSRTVLHRIAHNRSRAYTAVIAALVEAGADVNFTDEHGNSVLARAAGSAPAATVSLLISAGAVDLDREP